MMVELKYNLVYILVYILDYSELPTNKSWAIYMYRDKKLSKY